MAAVMILEARGRRIEFPRRALVMGIVNINDDSFCGDGTLDVTAALSKAEGMIRDGADIIDIGAESARTNRAAITEDEEVARLLPFIARWPELLSRCENETALLSVNTWRPGVVERVLPEGGDILNDISALESDANARLCAQTGAALLIMHTVGQPKVPHTHVGYPDVMAALHKFFGEKIALALAAGVRREQIILDPGIDFAKQREDNLTIYRRLQELHRWQRPILLPVSRKTVIGDVLDLPNPKDRDAGTIACIVAGMLRGAHIFRVHHVRGAAQAVKVVQAAGFQP